MSFMDFYMIVPSAFVSGLIWFVILAALAIAVLLLGLWPAPGEEQPSCLVDDQGPNANADTVNASLHIPLPLDVDDRPTAGALDRAKDHGQAPDVVAARRLGRAAGAHTI